MRSASLGIIGGGPAGVTASIYSSRYSVDHVLITKDIGGWASKAYKIYNYPGIPQMTGRELMRSYKEHLDSLETKVVFSGVESIEQDNGNFIVKTDDDIFSFSQLIYSAGTSPIMLDVPGERELIGKGVSYCATCDASLFKGKPVMVVGGGNSALSSAVMLSEKASSVIIITNEKDFTAEAAWKKVISSISNITTIFEDTVAEISGEDSVEYVMMDSGAMHNVDGVFIEIGFRPYTEPLKTIDVDMKEGYVTTDESQRTSVKGLYAAGDVVYYPFKQIITASSQGAMAAYSAYIDSKKE